MVDSFGFGLVSNGSQSFESVLNSASELYEIYTNQTVITPSFRGLGLPAAQYSKFAGLLSIVTTGASNCEGTAYCLLAQNCSAYSTLWDYQFQVSFADQVTVNMTNSTGPASANFTRTMYVPLATFANTNKNGMCEIYVEKLSSSQIVLGSMFFQSFYY